MEFGESKCAFLAIDKRKIIENHEAIVINGVAIKPLKDRDSHKYLGQNENIGYVGPLNKARGTAEYKKRVQKIWSSELSAYNKHIAHNNTTSPNTNFWNHLLDSPGNRELRYHDYKNIKCDWKFSPKFRY